MASRLDDLANVWTASTTGEGAEARARDATARRSHRAVPVNGADRRPVGGKGPPWAVVLGIGGEAAADQASRRAVPDHNVVAITPSRERWVGLLAVCAGASAADARRGARPPRFHRGEQHVQCPWREVLHTVPRRHSTAHFGRSSALPGAGHSRPDPRVLPAPLPGSRGQCRPRAPPRAAGGQARSQARIKWASVSSGRRDGRRRAELTGA